MKKIACLTASGIMLAASAFCGVNPAEVTEALVHEGTDGGRLPYRQYVSGNLADGEKIPLVIFLHGAGERGDDNARQLGNGVDSVMNFAIDHNIHFAMLIPQCPNPAQWVDTPWGDLAHRMPAEPSAPMKLLIELIDEKLASLPIDQSRIYVTGLSMGGYGTWDLCQRFPDRIAAAIPNCGGGDTTLAWKIRDIPIWAFHGSADTTVPTSRSRDMVAALWACNGNIRYHEYPGVGHGCWGATYANPEVLDWMFKQHR